MKTSASASKGKPTLQSSQDSTSKKKAASSGKLAHWRPGNSFSLVIQSPVYAQHTDPTQNETQESST